MATVAEQNASHVARRFSLSRNASYWCTLRRLREPSTSSGKLLNNSSGMKPDKHGVAGTA